MNTRIPALLILCACGGPPPEVDPDIDTGDTDITDSAAPPTPTPSPTPTPVPATRRHDCGGIEPADLAPLAGRIALTFDDGPHPTHTATILEELQARDIPATFFVVGERLSESASWLLVDRIVADSRYILANHSWDHSNLADLSVRARDAQIDDTSALIETFGPSPLYFRFPFGASTCRSHDDVTDRALRVTGWHIDTADWCYSAVGATGVCLESDYWRVPPEHEGDMIAYTVEQAQRYDGGIVLLHDIHAWTAEVLPDLLDALENAGFTFVALDDLDAFPNLNAGTPADMPYLGESCDTVADTCFHAEYFAWCEPTDLATTDGICTMPCEGLCPDRDGAALTFCAELSTGAGQCTSRAESLNDWCADLPGAVPLTMDRHIGSSGASVSRQQVCGAEDWD